jgi:hypothetical protein
MGTQEEPVPTGAIPDAEDKAVGQRLVDPLDTTPFQPGSQVVHYV